MILDDLILLYRKLSINEIAEKYKEETGHDYHIKNKIVYYVLPILFVISFITGLLSFFLLLLKQISVLLPNYNLWIVGAFTIYVLSTYVMMMIILTLKGDSRYIIDKYLKNKVNIENLRNNYIQDKIKGKYLMKKNVDRKMFFSSVLQSIDDYCTKSLIVQFPNLNIVLTIGILIINSSELISQPYKDIALLLLITTSLILLYSYQQSCKKEISNKLVLYDLKTIILDMQIKDSISIKSENKLKEI